MVLGHAHGIQHTGGGADGSSGLGVGSDDEEITDTKVG
jgi:hypothetical protein